MNSQQTWKGHALNSRTTHTHQEKNSMVLCMLGQTACFGMDEFNSIKNNYSWEVALTVFWIYHQSSKSRT